MKQKKKSVEVWFIGRNYYVCNPTPASPQVWYSGTFYYYLGLTLWQSLLIVGLGHRPPLPPWLKKTPQHLAPRPHWERRNIPGSLRRLLGRSDGSGLHPAVGSLGVEDFRKFCPVETAEIYIVGERHTMHHGTCDNDHKGFPVLGRDV